MPWTGENPDAGLPAALIREDVPVEVADLADEFARCVEDVTLALQIEEATEDAELRALRALMTASRAIRAFVEDRLPRSQRQVTPEQAADLDRLVNGD